LRASVRVYQPASSKQFKALQRLSEEIKKTRAFPKLLSVGVAFTFFFYMFGAYVSWIALVNFEYGISFGTELLINILWASAHSLFFIIGVSTAVSGSSAMKQEYEEIKKELELVEPANSEGVIKPAF
jgi:uncharacterized BrkB/YihY/UPF0761 family membrane protein